MSREARERHRDIVPIEKPTAEPRQGGDPITSKGLPLIEFSTEAQEDCNENVQFGDSPVHCTCPHCERTVVTFIDYETSWVTYLLGFVVWFSLGWMAFWVLPLLWPAFKDVVHHCPRCLNVIARKSRISLPTFRSEVMSLKVGSCAIVLARKYVVILCGLLTVIITVAILRSTVHISPGAASRETMPKGEPSKLTWEDFLFECGPRTSLGHRSSAVRNFEEHFRKRTFNWQGEVILIREGFDVFFLHAKSVVMIRMDPPRYPRRDLPDIALLFSEDRNSEVAPLMKGDKVDFEATMTAHGNRGDPEVMALWHIKQAATTSQSSPAPESSSPAPAPRKAPAPVTPAPVVEETAAPVEPAAASPEPEKQSSAAPAEESSSAAEASSSAPTPAPAEASSLAPAESSSSGDAPAAPAESSSSAPAMISDETKSSAAETSHEAAKA